MAMITPITTDLTPRRGLPASPANLPTVGRGLSSTARSFSAPLPADHARIEALPAGQVFHPTRLQFAQAYLRNGDAPPMFGLPPIALDDLAIFAFTIAACLALGILLGSAIA